MTVSPATISRLLVVKLAGIGDLLTAFPALEALRARYPGAEISALVTPQTEQLLTGSGLVDRVMVLDKYLFDSPTGFLRPATAPRLWRLAADLRRGQPDVAVLLHHLVTWPGIAKYAFLMMAAGAPLRAGLDDGRGKFLNLAAPDRGFGAMHEVEYWLEVAKMLGASNPHPRVRLSWGPAEDSYALRRWADLGFAPSEPVVAIHPGTGSYSPARRWNPESFAAVATALVGDGLRPMVVAGPGEEALAAEVVSHVSARCGLLEGVPTLRSLAAILARCRLFVGNDSGVMHLAHAAGAPVVAVFGPSNHLAWGPYDPARERTRVVRRDLACSPCLYRKNSLGLRYGCGDPTCLQDLSPSLVVAAARDLLGSIGGLRPAG